MTRKLNDRFCFTIHNIHKCLDTLLYASGSQCTDIDQAAAASPGNWSEMRALPLYPPRPRESETKATLISCEPFSGF